MTHLLLQFYSATSSHTSVWEIMSCAHTEWLLITLRDNDVSLVNIDLIFIKWMNMCRWRSRAVELKPPASQQIYVEAIVFVLLLCMVTCSQFEWQPMCERPTLSVVFLTVLYRTAESDVPGNTSMLLSLSQQSFLGHVAAWPCFVDVALELLGCDVTWFSLNFYAHTHHPCFPFSIHFPLFSPFFPSFNMLQSFLKENSEC